jgi:hypothetical protein
LSRKLAGRARVADLVDQLERREVGPIDQEVAVRADGAERACTRHVCEHGPPGFRLKLALIVADAV